MDRVLMYSSGMDSFILKKLYNFADKECLFVKIGTVENKQEELFIDKYFNGISKIEFPLAPYELSNKIIPFRNHILALLGAQYAPNIYFGFTLGDSTRDKDYVFKAQMESITNYFAAVPEKIKFPGKQYTIQMPLKNKTKTELVRMYMAEGYSIQELKEKTRSCYNGGDKACGTCRSCVRNFVALSLNGINTDNWFVNNPAAQLNQLLQESINKNRQAELKDIRLCIKQRLL